MKKFLQAMIGLAALGMAAPALAADLPASPYKAPPVMIPAWYDWSGFYVGLNGGGGSSHNCWSVTNEILLGVISPPAAEGCNNAVGGAAGGQIGYRWQINSWVFGVEGQGDWTDFKGSNANLFFTGAPFNENDQSRMDAFGLLTGQVGYAWDKILFYVKGGGAVTANRYATYANVSNGQMIDNSGEARWGGTVGAGLEFSFAPDWSVAFEYDHLFMGTRDVNSNFVGNFGPVGLFSATNRISQDVDIGTVRINYRWGGPVIAKY